MNIYQTERSIGLLETQKTIEDYLEKNGLNAEFLIAENTKEVSFVNLYDHSNKLLSNGAGKGVNHKLGAVCEALEHYFNEREGRIPNPLSLDKLTAQKQLKKDYYLQKLGESTEGELCCEKFIECNRNDEVYIPAGYVNPAIYSFIAKPTKLDVAIGKFSTNNGSSLGLTLTDSLLHGFNEAIERHYESLFYQDLVALSSGIKWLKSTSSDLVDYNEKAKIVEEIFGRFDCYYTRTEFETWVVFAVCRSGGSESMAAIGAGSSITFKLALQRAIDELCQTLVLRESLTEKDDETAFQEDDALKILGSNVGLINLITLRDDYIKSIENGNLGYLLNNEKNDFSDAKSQLEFLIKNLTDNGYTPLYQKILEKEGVVLAQAFVPEFDKFFVIRKGSLVAPLISYF